VREAVTFSEQGSNNLRMVSVVIKVHLNYE
jgi:hypothetical protein